MRFLWRRKVDEPCRLQSIGIGYRRLKPPGFPFTRRRQPSNGQSRVNRFPTFMGPLGSVSADNQAFVFFAEIGEVLDQYPP